MSATFPPSQPPKPAFNNHGGKVNWKLAYEREAARRLHDISATTSPSSYRCAPQGQLLARSGFSCLSVIRPLCSTKRTSVNAASQNDQKQTSVGFPWKLADENPRSKNIPSGFFFVSYSPPQHLKLSEVSGFFAVPSEPLSTDRECEASRLYVR
jgi:hypothetical protein